MSNTQRQTARWEWLAICSAAFLVIALPLYYLLDDERPGGEKERPRQAQFVGSEECRDCHEPEFERWQGSHHDMAMDVAREESVLGDFDDAEFTHLDVTSRFYRRDGKYFVHTAGPGGAMGDFEITHTFGWFPLQQYLVPFPGGRLQTLPIAWDSRDNRWFRVPPTEYIDPGDWLYWTNAAQNWNGMCAQCHSTNLQKNYDPENDRYDTTWSDIDVGCEACHGAGSLHVEWARLPDMARPAVPNLDLPMRTSGISSTGQVEICAPCHSRRTSMADLAHDDSPFLDTFLPSLLTEGLYFPDGQILDEVYVYGSFTQSKMYQRGVRCSDCHDVHSVKTLLEDNELCLQCHQSARYDTPDHHFHKQAGEAGEPIRSPEGEILFEVGSGALCRECHMPGRYYMGNDYRPDHGFRTPNPALSEAIGSPDPCLRCHVDQDAAWSVEKFVEWYGPGRRAHYGEVIAAGRNGESDAAPELIALSADGLYPVLVRATALSLLGNYPGAESSQALRTAMLDDEPVIRRTAVSMLELSDPGELARALASALEDPVLTVRIEAANRLAGPLTGHLGGPALERFEAVLEEYRQTLLYSADFPFAHFNLGNLANAMGQPDSAVKEYEAAIRIDSQFLPARVNLAMLYNQMGENARAEILLREVLEQQPQMYEIAYSLGLLLVEMKRYEEAAGFLADASDGLPQRGRVHYNLGLLYQQLGDMAAAEAKLSEALEQEPANPDFLYGLTSHYMNRGRFDLALPLAEQLERSYPQNADVRRLVSFIREQAGR